jgi:hypothetical protein
VTLGGFLVEEELRVMTTYKLDLTIEDPEQLIISNLPFQRGDRVEIIISTKEREERKALVGELKDLFKRTQSLPSSKAITEEEIEAEIEAYRIINKN